MATKYFVIREIRWPHGNHVVRIISDMKYADRGKLEYKFEYLGEGKEFTHPRLAADCAVKIKNAWAETLKGELIDFGFDSQLNLSPQELLRKLFYNG